MKSNKRIYFLAISALLFCLLLVYVRSILLPFVMGIILAYLMIPLVKQADKLMIPDWTAIAVIYAYIGIVIVLVVNLCLPVFILQSKQLIDKIPSWSEAFMIWWDNIANKLPDFLIHSLSDTRDATAEYLASRFGSFSLQIPNLITVVLYLILTPILAYYFLRDRKEILRKTSAFFSPDQKNELRRLVSEADDLIRRFVSGYLVVALLIGLLSTGMYFVIGLNYSLVLGIIMGITDLIPYFGPFIGAIPALIVSLEQGRSTFILTGIGIFILQQLENTVIAPKVMGNKIGLNPIMTIFVVLAGNQIFGILGAILSVPVSAILLLAIRYIYSQFVGVKPENL